MTIIKSTPAEGVLLLEISRPPVNAIDSKSWLDLRDKLQSASSDVTCRCVVLASGLTGFFSAGIDLPEFTAKVFDRKLGSRFEVERSLRRLIRECQAAVSAIELCRKPVIGIANGTCIGFGVELLAACDIRLASKDVKFSIPEVDVGMAADLGLLQRFPRIVANDSWAREVLYTSRPFDAKEALLHGFISGVESSHTEAVDAGVRLAVTIASKPAIAIAGTKILLRHGLNNATKEHLEFTTRWSATNFASSAFRAVLNALLSQRKAKL